jgi:glycosyltransferase involved in cell wall biosynthesis
MQIQKEEKFISIVLIAPKSSELLVQRLGQIGAIMDERFRNYELVVVDNMLSANVSEAIKKYGGKVVLVELARRHDGQSALAAGIDISIGDYIFEMEDISVALDYHILLDMYDASQNGNDFVFFTPRNTRISSRGFYKILNWYYRSIIPSDIPSSIVTLSSRRGQNKTAATGIRIVNHSVSYALTGLRCSSLDSPVRYANRRGFMENIGLMLDTFIYYTDLITKLATVISGGCFVCALTAIVYSIVAHFVSAPASGWSSLVILGSLAFSAIFLLLAIVCKYLGHILSNTTQTKSYVFRNINK